MVEFKPSHLIALKESLVETENSVPVAIPSRLLLNNSLRNQILAHEQWFYDRTFPLWTAGKASGLVFKRQDSDDNFQEMGLILGRILFRDGTYRELQLIGTGQRPGDDKKSSGCKQPCYVIEALASEFCYQMGIPSSRVLCIISNNGYNPDAEGTSPHALFTRIAHCYITFGHILDAAAKENFILTESILHLARDYFGHHEKIHGPFSYQDVFDTISNNMLKTVASWQAAGFYYGEFSSGDYYISGETMNFQNSGFIDTLNGDMQLFSGRKVSTTCFMNQPELGLDLCLNLYQALVHYTDENYSAVAFREILNSRYHTYFSESLCKKLAIHSTAENLELVSHLLVFIRKHNVNYFTTFNKLGDEDSWEFLLDTFNRDEDFKVWLKEYRHQKILFQENTDHIIEWEKINPARPLKADDISHVSDALYKGNRNALENCLESIQQGKAPTLVHWAS